MNILRTGFALLCSFAVTLTVATRSVAQEATELQVQREYQERLYLLEYEIRMNTTYGAPDSQGHLQWFKLPQEHNVRELTQAGLRGKVIILSNDPLEHTRMIMELLGAPPDPAADYLDKGILSDRVPEGLSLPLYINETAYFLPLIYRTPDRMRLEVQAGVEKDLSSELTQDYQLELAYEWLAKVRVVDGNYIGNRETLGIQAIHQSAHSNSCTGAAATYQTRSNTNTFGARAGYCDGLLLGAELKRENTTFELGVQTLSDGETIGRGKLTIRF